MASDFEKPNMNLTSEPRGVGQDGIYSDENPENAVAEHRKQFGERQKEAQQLVSDIKDLIQSGTDRTNEQIRLKEEQLRQVLDIPPDNWIRPSDTTSMETVVSKFDRYFSDMNTVLNHKEEWTTSQLVAKASAGAALRGVLVGEIGEPKNIVLSTPEKVTLMSPNMQQISEIKVNSSKEQSDRFLKCLDLLGYSVAASEQSQESQSPPTQSTFLSQVMYTLVPTAAVEIRPKDLRFSEQALQELKKVDEAVKASDDKEAIRSTCEQFFELYGSHVNAGLIHFGGVSKLVATYSSETESDIDTTRPMVNEALNAYASMSYSGSEVSVEGSISGDAVELQRSISSSYSRSELAKIQLLTCNNGGPYDVNTLPLWRMGLMTHNSTWALIDRGGRSSNDFVGVWELLPNHEEFDNPHVLASTLKNAWKQKQDITNGDNGDDFVFSFRNSLEVKAYNSMEAKYYELEWELQSAVMSWMQKAENKMRSCETVDDLEMCLQGMFDDLNKVINTKLDTTRKSLEGYFEKSNLQDIMIQWQQAKLNALHFDADKRHTEGKKHLLAVKEAHRVDLLRRTKLEKHKSEITSKAVELADQLKGKETSDEKLRGKFNKMWIPMVNELASKYHEENAPLDTIVESILWSRFNAQRHLSDVELQRNPLGKPINLTSLEKSIKMEYVHETDISLMSTYLDQLKKVGSKVGVSKHPLEVARHKVVLVTCQILQDIDVHLKDLCSQDIKFQESLATNVIRMLTQGIEHFNENKPEDCHFSILPRYTVKLAVHVGRQCVQLFTRMQDKYEKKMAL